MRDIGTRVSVRDPAIAAGSLPAGADVAAFGASALGEAALGASAALGVAAGFSS